MITYVCSLSVKDNTLYYHEFTIKWNAEHTWLNTPLSNCKNYSRPISLKHHLEMAFQLGILQAPGDKYVTKFRSTSIPTCTGCKWRENLKNYRKLEIAINVKGQTTLLFTYTEILEWEPILCMLINFEIYSLD